MEETASGRRGDAGDRGEGLLGLRKASHNGHRVQIPGAGLDSGRLQLYSGGREPS